MTNELQPEMIGDLIYRIAPEYTPLYSLLATSSVPSEGVSGSPVQRFSKVGAVNRDELLDRLQVQRRLKDPEALVTPADLEVACRSELQRAKVLKALAQKRDIEQALLSSFAPSPEIEGLTPARMWTLGYEPTIYQRGELTEAAFKAFLAKMFAAGANTSHCFAPPVEGKTISKFCALATTHGGNEIYVSDFSPVEVASTIFAERGRLIFIDSNLLKLGVHKPMQSIDKGENTFAIEMEVTPVREEGCVIGVFEVVE